MIETLLVDDHELIRAGLRQVLEGSMDIRLAAEAGTGAEAIAWVRKQAFDVMLLDISLPDMSGMDVLRVAKTARPAMAVLVVSGYPEAQYARNVLKAGAMGYAGKDTSPARLVEAILMVARGQRYISPSLASDLAMGLVQSMENAPHSYLSEREFQVFSRLAAGQSPTDIANALNLSIKTISTHRARILEKMNMKTNADLIYYAIKNELV